MPAECTMVMKSALANRQGSLWCHALPSLLQPAATAATLFLISAPFAPFQLSCPPKRLAEGRMLCLNLLSTNYALLTVLLQIEGTTSCLREFCS